MEQFKYTFILIIVPALILVVDLVLAAIYTYRYKKQNGTLEKITSTVYFQISLYVFLAVAFFMFIMLANKLILESWARSFYATT